MKKINLFLTMVLFAVGISLQAKASSSLILSPQLADYEKQLAYIHCKFTTDKNCTGANSIKEAKEKVADYRKKKASGFHSRKKRAMDKVADRLMLKISKAEALNFLIMLSKLPFGKHSKYMSDSITGKITVVSPNFNLDSDSPCNTKVMSKNDMLSSLNTTYGDDSGYAEALGSLFGNKFSEMSFEFLNQNTEVVVSHSDIENIEEANMSIKSDIKIVLRRDPTKDYSIVVERVESSIVNKIESKK